MENFLNFQFIFMFQDPESGIRIRIRIRIQDKTLDPNLDPDAH